jgi:hypothetical protein
VISAKVVTWSALRQSLRRLRTSIPSLPVEVEELREIKSIEIMLELDWRSETPLSQSNLQKIDRLKNLKSYTIEVHFGPLRTHFPKSIGALTNLHALKFSGSGLVNFENLSTPIGGLREFLKTLKIRARRLESLPLEILNFSIECLDISYLAEAARTEDFFVPGCNLQKSLVNVTLVDNKLGEKDRLTNIWRFLSGCPKLESVSLWNDGVRNLSAFMPTVQGGEANPTASRLRMLGIHEWNNRLEEDPEVLVALLNTHLQLEYRSFSSSFPPQVQYLMDLNRCGRILLEGRGITSIPLSAWPRILERTNTFLDGKVERNASAVYYFLRSGVHF